MEQVEVREDEPDHRLDDRDGADGDGRVVAAGDGDGGVFQRPVHGFLRHRDGGGRLQRDADDEGPPRGNAAEDAPRMVRQEGVLETAARGGAHGVVVPAAARGGGGEAVADLHPLRRVQPHAHVRYPGVQLVVEGLPEAGGDAGGADFDNAAQRIAGGDGGFDFPAHGGDRRRVGAEEGIAGGVSFVLGEPGGGIGLRRAQPDKAGPHADAGGVGEGREHFPRHRAGGDAGRRLAGGGTAAAADVVDAVFLPVCRVRVAGAEKRRQRGIIPRPLIRVFDEEADGVACRLAIRDAGEYSYLVRFAARSHVRPRAGAAAVEHGLDVLLRQGDEGGAAVDDAADGGAVAFAEGGDGEETAAGVVGAHDRLLCG